MKNNTIKKVGTLFLFFLLVGVQSTQAQFWKKIKERAKEGVEEAILRKTEEKATKETEKAIDSIFSVPKKIGEKKKRTSTNDDSDISEKMEEAYEEDEIILPDTYDFEWKYVLKMEAEKIKKKKKKEGDMKMVYYLNTDTPVFGILIDMENKGPKMGNTIMIMDSETGANIMLMEMDGQKFIQKMPSFATEDIDEALNKEIAKDYTIEKTDTKIILGYTCQGFKITTEDGIIRTYVAQDAPVSFNNTMSSNSKFKPKGFDSKWLKEFENGLMMEMEFTSTKKKKHNMKMTCVELVKEAFSVNLSEYKSFMEMRQ